MARMERMYRPGEIAASPKGEEIVIAKAGTPMARLVPLAGTDHAGAPGGWEGMVWFADDFDPPLPASLLAAFTGDGAPAPSRKRAP
jgi:antitoxin (DNA-binding transcriptional repressor) of toxin-antitoxin stability system